MNNLRLRKIILDSSSPYLIAKKGMWINADGKEISFNDMDKEYKEKCYNVLKREREGIEMGLFLGGVECSQEESDEVMKMVMELYSAKLQELENELR